jgi:hypothetical protein
VLIIRCVGEGGYATVYQVDRCDVASTATIDSNFSAALKVQSPASIWEFYIGTQLEAKIPQNMVSAPFPPSLSSLILSYSQETVFNHSVDLSFYEITATHHLKYFKFFIFLFFYFFLRTKLK